ncbi:MAG: hypothetical protein KGM96_14055 [Acidobacteriota bacterium]|nr:hypothetical protein [Acidobacteriota bacterium]
MKEHYEAVLRDMESQEARLEAQLAKIRAARPAILALMEDASPKPITGPSLFNPPKYAGMGPKEAVIHLLSLSQHPMDTSDIEIELRNGQVKTSAEDFPAVVKSTLANLKKDGVVERLEDGWRLKPRSTSVDPSPSWSPTAQRQPLQQ